MQFMYVDSYFANLQTAAMDDLVINSELTALIIDDKDTNTAAAIVERVLQTGEQIALVKDRKTLLDISSLSHSNNTSIITDIQNAVLLEHRTDHVLNNDGRAWVADERGLLVQLLGEEVDTEVAVLASLSGSGDANDLARTALEHEQVTNADVVAWDGDGVGHASVLDAAGRAFVARSRHLDFAVGDDYLFFTLNNLWAGRVVVVTTLVALEWVEDAVGSAVKTVTEGVVVTVFVVISHIKLVTTTGRTVDGTLFNLYLLVEGNGLTLGVVLSVLLARIGGLVLPTTRSTVLLGEWGGAVTELSLGDIDAGIDVDLGSWSVTGRILAVVDAVLDVDLGVGVTLVRLAVSLAFDVDLYARVDVLLLLIAADACVADVFADILTSASAGCAVAVFFGDADVLAEAVVSTGRGGLLRDLEFLTSIFPSSALDSDSLVSLDFGGFGSLLVLVA